MTGILQGFYQNVRSFGPLPISYWVSQIYSVVVNNTVSSVASDIDSTGNVYVLGRGMYSGQNGSWWIAKFNSSGVFQLQKTLSVTSTGFTTPYAITVDKINNVFYVTGYAANSDTLSPNIRLAKYDCATLTLQWQISLGSTTTGRNNQSRKLAVDSAGNVYICALGNGLSGNFKSWLIKYNSSGTLQWQVSANYSSSTYHQGLGITIDSSNNIYIVGKYDGFPQNDTTIHGYLLKFNSSGGLLFDRTTKWTTPADTMYESVATYGAETIVGFTQSPGICGIIKYDLNGDFSFKREIYGASANWRNQTFTTVRTDSVGNIYLFAMQDNTAPSYTCYLFKWNISGTLQWQRMISGTGGLKMPSGLSIDSNNNLVICFTGGFEDYIAKLSKNGTGAGTYAVGTSSFTYGASSWAESAGGASSTWAGGHSVATGDLQVDSSAMGTTYNSGIVTTFAVATTLVE